MIEALVTACQPDDSGAAGGAVSTFTADAPFQAALPFLRLHAGLASDPDVALEPANFALPAVRQDAPWPPPDGSIVLHPIYLHAQQQLRTIAHAAAHARSRSRAARPELPELPISLSATPCVSMLLHPGRLVAHTDEPMVRVAVVSMLVRDALPPELTFAVRASPWGDGGAPPPPPPPPWRRRRAATPPSPRRRRRRRRPAADARLPHQPR